MRTKSGGISGITLIEALIGVAILTIIASIVVPEFTVASVDMRDDSLHSALTQIRKQIKAYQKDHGGALPSGENFVAQMTMRTNSTGQVCPMRGGNIDDYPHGPYLKRIPRNPYVNRRVSNRVEVGTKGPGGGNAGWYYNPTTGQISPDDDFHRNK